MNSARISPNPTQRRETDYPRHASESSDHELDYQHHAQRSSRERRSYSTPMSLTDAKIKVTKAFKQVVESKAAEKYDGKDLMKYTPWKIALKGEVVHLEIDSTQWLELLKLRTDGLARKVVDRACLLQQELTAKETVQLAWDYLDHQFQTQKKPSQPILFTLQCGPHRGGHHFWVEGGMPPISGF